MGLHFAESTKFEHADGRLVVGAAAALDLDEDTSIAAKNLGKDTHAAATCNLSEDTNAAAAKEKAKRRDVMSKSQENKNEKTKEKARRRDVLSKSQENKNEKTSEGDDEVSRLVEERRNTAKGEKHKLKELCKRIKKCIRKEKEQNDKRRYNRFWKNLEASRVNHA